MKRHHSLFAGLLLLSATNAQSLPGPNDPSPGVTSPRNALSPSASTKAAAAGDFARLPLSFESNQGQTNSRVRFLTHSGDNTLFLTPSEAVFSLTAQTRQKEKRSLLKDRKAHRSAEKIARVALRMQMVGANSGATTLEQQPLAGRVNYFIGKDPRKWHAGVPTFGRVGFHQVYPGVDVVYYGNQQHLEYDFVVAPHADPRQIKLRFAGARGVHIDASGDLVVGTSGQELKWQKPRGYQQDATGKHAVTARFRLKKLPSGQTGVSFALGRYDTARPLVIDPVLTYSTYLNAYNDDSNRGTTCIAVDSGGNVFMGGDIDNADFPTTPGAYNTTLVGTFVAKMNPTGTGLVYATYLGGANGNEDLAAIAVDSAGNAYAAGYTQAPDFPVTPGAFSTTTGTGFVAKLNPTGTALVYSTRLGGTGIFDIVSGMALDSKGDAYVCGRTLSSDFPTTPGAFQTVYKSHGNGNAFVTELNPTGAGLVYSTYLGGSGPTPGGSDHVALGDAAYGIAVDSAGNAYLTGETGSLDFPVTSGAFQTINHRVSGSSAGTNAFVSKLNPTGSALVYSTFLGGSSGVDLANAIAIDSTGSAYITGSAYSFDFPTTPGAYQRAHPDSPYSTTFVSKLDPTGSNLIYSTLLGGNTWPASLRPGDGYGIAVDILGNACVVGDTSSTDFPTTPGAFQRVRKVNSLYTAFFTKLNTTGTALLYSTYLSGSGQPTTLGDAALALALDSVGNVYITGRTYSNDFPTTPGAQQSAVSLTGKHGTSFVTKLSTAPISTDFNNDGKTDLLIQNASTGFIASWFMNGSTWMGGAYFSYSVPTDFALVGTGDFQGNGTTALVIQNRNDNRVGFYYVGGANHATINGGEFVNVIPNAGWKVVGVGDFNGDGKADLLFQNQTTYQLAIWFMNGAVYQGGMLLNSTPAVGWKVVGTGDLNADGFPDIVFQNQTTNQIAVWFMNGTTYAGGMIMPTVPGADWKVRSVGDYNGDGSADLMLQNQTTNQAMVWYLNSGVFQSVANLTLNPPSGWQIVGPR